VRNCSAVVETFGITTSAYVAKNDWVIAFGIVCEVILLATSPYYSLTQSQSVVYCVSWCLTEVVESGILHCNVFQAFQTQKES
jgi:hypothetical protein